VQDLHRGDIGCSVLKLSPLGGWVRLFPTYKLCDNKPQARRPPSSPFLLINDQIEGCPPGVDLDTKKGEVDKRTAEVEGPVVEEWDCGSSPPAEELVQVFLFVSSFFLRASAASLLLAISMSDWFAIWIISGVLFRQDSISNLVIFARWYFKWLIPP
jgi:hypothetical protein